MAIDKAVDSAVLDAGLTAIANAIREKAGTEGALAFPDGLVEAIRAIETGGDSNQVVVETFTCADTYANASNTYQITHGAGFVPRVYVIFDSSNNTAKTSHVLFRFGAKIPDTDKYFHAMFYSATGNAGETYRRGVCVVNTNAPTETTIPTMASSDNYARDYTIGITYTMYLVR